MSNILFDFDRDKLTITVISSYQAPLECIWAAWTRSIILDQWWAPHPWKVETKEMNFITNGNWLYAMVSPEGQRMWSLLEYLEISPNDYFIAKDSFCDENGVKNDTTHPGSIWHNTFVHEQNVTTVTNIITFKSITDLDQILEMGFREGFQMGLSNLEEYLKKL